jgi:LPXTG-site transpeptidase (sortase) family protein
MTTEQKKTNFLDLIWQYKYRFAFYIVTISVLTTVILSVFGAVPEELKAVDENQLPANLAGETIQAAVSNQTTVSTEAAAGNQDSMNGAASVGTISTAELPDRIIIPSAGIDAVVSNPDTTNIDTLDQFLLHGAVRYPESGALGSGNVLIFGHNTSLPVVNNQAFKTFDNLKNLTAGDIVKVQSSDKEYDYSVVSVTLIYDSQAIVDLSSNQNELILSTCNVLGAKEQRYVVVAAFEGVRPLN